MASPEIEQIKERLNIAEVVGQYVQLQKAGRNMRARCPFHKERTPSFMVSPERGTYMCFGCSEQGDIFSFVEKMEGIDFRTALVQLADKAGVKLPKFSAVSAEQKNKEEQLTERLLACGEAATQFFEIELNKQKAAQEYLAKRTVLPATIKTWRVGYAPASWEALAKHLIESGFTKEEIVGAGLGLRSEKKPDELYDRFRGRIMFPIFDMANRVIAFSGRFFENVEGSREEREGTEPAKYVNSPETLLFKKSRTLYGLHAAKETIRKADCILLVEGQFDLLLAQQSGLRFAVAVSGTALTPEHLSLLSRYSKRLVLGLDNDVAGLRSGIKSAALALALGFDVKVPQLPDDCKDPADTAAKDPELLKTAVRESKTAIEFFLEALKKDAKDERAYKKIVESQILPLIAALPSKIDQAHFIAIVAGRLRVPEEAVRAEVAKTRAHGHSPHPGVPEKAVDAPAAHPDGRLSRLEKTAALIIFHTDLTHDARQKLAELLGEDRIQEIKEQTAARAEEFRFQFDSIEREDAEIFEMLLAAIAQEKLEEAVSAARRELHEAHLAGDASKELESTRKIQALAKEKHSK